MDQTTRTYEYRRIAKPGDGDYQALKKKAGPLAATDEQRKSRTTHDQRFQMSGLMKEALSIEAEERRAIQERVDLEVAKIKEQAHAEGLTRGLEEGRAAGVQEAHAELRKEATTTLSQLQSLFEGFEGLKNRVFEENAQFVLGAMAQVCKRVILKELSTDQDYVLRLTRELIEKTGVRENIKILVSAETFKHYEVLQAGIKQVFSNLQNISIEPSDRVKAGGVIFESQWNSIDARLESQLQHLEASLLGHAVAAPAAGENA